MELRRRIEKALAEARRCADVCKTQSTESYWHGYAAACERILEEVVDIGCREHEKASR